jgi:hypothetical protein
MSDLHQGRSQAPHASELQRGFCGRASPFKGNRTPFANDLIGEIFNFLAM